jgi:PTH2 family peptidyl-tRNA hydrolase
MGEGSIVFTYSIWSIEMDRPKQVIVMRRYFPDGKGGRKKVRTGKMIAQGAHASMAAVLDLMSHDLGRVPSHPGDFDHDPDMNFIHRSLEMRVDSPLHEWIEGSFAKVAVYVDTEEELLELYSKVKKAGLPCALITDSGRTEFGGVPTNTCIAVGPDLASKIDPFTKHLKLL